MSAVRKRNVTKIETSYVQQQDLNEAQVKRKRKRVIRRLSVFFVFAAVVAYFMINTLISQTYSIDQLKLEKSKLNDELNQLKKQEVILKEDIVKLNDDEYIAKLARKDYFLSKKNEVIFNIPDEQ